MKCKHCYCFNNGYCNLLHCRTSAYFDWRGDTIDITNRGCKYYFEKRSFRLRLIVIIVLLVVAWIIL